MRFIAIMAVSISSLVAGGYFDSRLMIWDQPFALIATLISGTGLVYVLARG